MEQQTEKKDITVPLFAFNIALVGLIVSLGFLIYNVDIKRVHMAEETAPPPRAVFETPSLRAQSFIVWDIKKQAVIAEKESQVARPLASITKVMSALVARKMLPKESEVVVRKEFLVEEGDSGLRDGEVFKLSTFIFLREKIIAIRFNKPTWFSVYTVIVYSCFSSFIIFYLSLISETLHPCGTIGNTLFSFPTITSNK